MRDKPLILIVDDEANFREIFGLQLKSAGFDVAEADSSKTAVEKAIRISPDLVLMDIHLAEEKTGTDAALEIKQHPKTADTKIAFLTSLKDPWPGIAGENVKVAKEIGMEDYLNKTDDPAQ